MSDRGWSNQGQGPFLTWAVASRPMKGQAVSGDQATVQVSGSRTVMAVIDGLGHGPEAATAARLAIDVIDNNPAEPLEVLLLLLHRELGSSRGAAATLAVMEGEHGLMDWLGVGNVDGVLVRSDIEARPRNRGVFLISGVLGYHMGNMHHPEPVALEPGDVIVIATDGIRANLAEVARLDLSIDRLAQKILTKYSRADDDALVLVARYQPAAGSVPPTDASGRVPSSEPPEDRPMFGPQHHRRDPGRTEGAYGPLGPSSDQ
jgi:negative regulator of sigma-B (phosphoserine phosphatase)